MQRFCAVRRYRVDRCKLLEAGVVPGGMRKHLLACLTALAAEKREQGEQRHCAVRCQIATEEDDRSGKLRIAVLEASQARMAKTELSLTALSRAPFRQSLPA